ncbi:hypothetical protein P8452_25866 [Trifolium repens]|nr:hypothetical protein P8452_25866 [Trifolium repens]
MDPPMAFPSRTRRLEQTPPAPQRAPPAPQQAPPPNEVQVYGGGPHDLSLLTEYYKHRAIPIWEANPNNHDLLKRKLRCIAGAKRVTDINKPNEDQDWLLGQKQLRWLATCHFFRDG